MLNAGEAVVTTGSIQVESGGSGEADYVAAVIGPELPEAAVSASSGSAPAVNPSNNGGASAIDRGSITATGYLCPGSVSNGGDLSACTVTADFDVVFAYDLEKGNHFQTSFGADGSFDGTAYYLERLPLQATGSAAKGEDYLIDPANVRQPAGSTGMIVQGDGVQPIQGAYQFVLSAATPTAVLAIYFFTNP